MGRISEEDKRFLLSLKPSDITLEYLNKVYPEMSALVKVDEDVKNSCASIIKDVQEKKNYFSMMLQHQL